MYLPKRVEFTHKLASNELTVLEVCKASQKLPQLFTPSDDRFYGHMDYAVL